MADQKLDALSALYSEWMAKIAANPSMPLDEVRGLFEHWGDVTVEPKNIDYRLEYLPKFQAMWVEPRNCNRGKVLLCAHGGGYVLGSMYTHRKVFGHFAAKIGCRALIVDYRRAPEHLHPGPLDDMVDAYEWLLASGEVKAPQDVVFLGDSAGGALALTMLLRAKERKLPMPKASIAIAPYLDLEATSDSYDRNGPFDALGAREGTRQFGAVFLGPKGSTKDPLVNAALADLTGLPPILVQVGAHDVLEDDSVNFHARAKASGVDCTLEIYPGMPHVFHFMAGAIPEADEAIDNAARWVKPRLGLS